MGLLSKYREYNLPSQVASITYQSMFRLFPTLAGMTGTLHPEAYTPKLESSTLNPTPSTFHHQTKILNLNPEILYPKSSILNPQFSTLNPQPSTLNPGSSNLNPQPATLNSQPARYTLRYREDGGPGVQGHLRAGRRPDPHHPPGSPSN